MQGRKVYRLAWVGAIVLVLGCTRGPGSSAKGVADSDVKGAGGAAEGVQVEVAVTPGALTSGAVLRVETRRESEVATAAGSRPMPEYTCVRDREKRFVMRERDLEGSAVAVNRRAAERLTGRKPVVLDAIDAPARRQ